MGKSSKGSKAKTKNSSSVFKVTGSKVKKGTKKAENAATVSKVVKTAKGHTRRLTDNADELFKDVRKSIASSRQKTAAGVSKPVRTPTQLPRSEDNSAVDLEGATLGLASL